jgi:hypothetical protein
MSKCKNKVSQTCIGSTTQAVCVKTDVTVNSESSLINDDCLNVEETTQDLYNQIGEIKKETDLSELGLKCLTYTKVSGKILTKNVLLKHEQEICDLKTKVTALETTGFWDKKIEGSGLNLLCLLPPNPCNTTIITNRDLFQALINKVCLPNGAETKLISGITTDVTGVGTTALPYKVETVNLQKVITYPADFTGNSYTVTNADNHHTILIDNGTQTVNINVPTGLTAKTQVGFIQRGTADVVFVPQGTTLNSAAGLKIKGINLNAYIEKVKTTEVFQVLGNLKV